MSKKLGGTKAKDVNFLLDGLLHEGTIMKSMVGRGLYWSITGGATHEADTQTECVSEITVDVSELSKEKLLYLLLK